MAGARKDIEAGASYVRLYIRNSAFVRGLKDARQRLANFGSEMTAVGRQMVVASAAMLLPIAMGAKTFADFDDAMRQVKAVTGSTETEFAKLTETAKELGRTTSFTAIEVGALMAELGRAGFAADQINEMTSSVLNLARATSTEAPQAAGIMAASIRQFGLGAGDAGRVADGLTAAANKSFNTVEQLGEALSYAGPVAQDFNMSLEDTLAVLGGLGNVGIQGSNAGTAVRRLLTLTGAEAEKLKGIFGVTFLDAAGNTRPLVETLGEINDATADLGTGERAKKFNEAFGLLGITGASAIARSTGDIRELAAAIKDAGGIAGETAEEMDAGLGGAFRILRSATEGAMLALGEAVEGELTRVVEAGTEVLGIATKLVSENKEATVTYAKWAVAIGAAGSALVAVGLSAQIASFAMGGLLAVISATTFVFSTLVGAIGFLLSPLGLLVASLAAAGVAFFKFSDTGRSAVQAMSNRIGSILGDLKDTFGTTFSGIMDAIAAGDMGLAGQIAMTGLKLAFEQGMQAVTKIFRDAWNAITEEGALSNAWDHVVEEMSKAWSEFTQGIVSAMAEAARGVMVLWSEAVQGIVDKAAKGGVWGAVFKTMTGVDAGAAAKQDQALAAETAKTRSMLQTAIPETEQALKIAIDKGDQKEIDNLREHLEYLQASLDGIENSDPFSTIDALAESLRFTADAQKTMEDLQKGSESLPGGAIDKSPMDGAISSRTQRITQLQKELKALSEQAKGIVEESKKEGQSSYGVLAAPGGPGGDGSADGSGGGGSASAATFSARAALAMGQGFRGSPEVKATEEVKKAVVDMKTVTSELLNQLNINVKAQSLHHP